MKPEAGVVVNVEPAMAAQALGKTGEVYAIYLHVPLAKKPKDLAEQLGKAGPVKITLDLPAGSYQLTWLDPLSGQTEVAELLRHEGGEVRISSPRVGTDVAVEVRRK